MTTLPLDGQHALVTGGSRGIGKAIAMALAKAGATVLITARDETPLLQAGLELQDTPHGKEHRVQVSDASQPDDIIRLLDLARTGFNKLDIVVNNAAVCRDNKAENMTANQWDEVMATNLTGPFLIAQKAFWLFPEHGGCIINISSILAQRGNTHQVNYIAAKAGLEGMTRALAKEWGERNIRVNAIAPGLVETAMTKGLGQEAIYQIGVSSPLRRNVLPEEVAQVALYLATATAVTGQIITVDCGLSV